MSENTAGMPDVDTSDLAEQSELTPKLPHQLDPPVTAGVAMNRFVDVISGQFDADEEQPDLALPKRVLAPQAETPKLHKVLAQSGMGSRLEMEQLIMEGRITVNNEPAHWAAHSVRGPCQGQWQADSYSDRCAACARHRIP
jgi:23S rRNA pseudouridine2605 synthase